MLKKKIDLKHTADHEKRGHTAPSNPRQRAAGAAPAAGSSPNGNVLILGDDGFFHVVSRKMWLDAPVVATSDPGYPTLEILAHNGVYVANLPDGIGGGIGEFCTFVNQSIVDPSVGGGSGGSSGAGSGGASTT